MAREPVAVDYMGVGGAPVASPDGNEERVRLVRPIPTVPDNRAGHLRRSPALEGGRDNSAFVHHGLRQQHWNRVPVAARFQLEKENSNKVMVFPKKEKETTDDPLNNHPQFFSQRDNSAPASPSHHFGSSANRYDAFLRMQQSEKVTVTYGSHHQSLKGMQNEGGRTSPFRDEAQRGAQPPELATQPHPPSSQGGFGTTTPFYARSNSGVVESGAVIAGKKLPFQHPIQSGNLPRPGGLGKQPRTAQLTIFYAGMVNVYDDVPFDKAQAITLLAGSGNTWSSNFMNPPQAGSAASGRTFSAPTTVPPSTPSTPGSPAPQASTTSAPAPPRPLLPGVVFSNVRQPPIHNFELPQARKASLARFLEKRKDRVKKVLVKEEEDASLPGGNSEGPSVGKPPSRSPSPSPAVSRSIDRLSSPGRVEHQAGTSSGSERSSPSNPRPPQTPPSRSLSEERNAGIPKRKDFGLDHEPSKRARNGKSPCRLSGESAAHHIVDDGSSPHR